MDTVFFSLGSNVGDGIAHLQVGCRRLNELVGEVKAVSSFYETEPWGVADQDNYVNAVVKLMTEKSPHEIFLLAKKIEAEEGRTTQVKYSPRPLDIDILIYDELILKSDQLIIPHPKMHLRKFVLIPLCEIEPELVHPVLKKRMSDLLFECMDDLQVRKIPGSLS